MAAPAARQHVVQLSTLKDTISDNTDIPHTATREVPNSQHLNARYSHHINRHQDALTEPSQKHMYNTTHSHETATSQSPHSDKKTTKKLRRSHHTETRDQRPETRDAPIVSAQPPPEHPIATGG
jgi:hypothetical protein